MIQDDEIEALGEQVPLLEGIRTTRAIRRLRPEPVPAALVRKVVEAGTFAPSGGNRQPWIFVAVRDAERRAWIAERYRRAFEAYIVPAREAARSPEFANAKRRSIASASHLAATLHTVPVHLFVAGWKRRGEPQLQALYPAIQNILLACRAVGLGACLTNLHLAHAREIDTSLGLSDDRPLRRPVDDCLYWDRYTEPTS
jgi:nitroreductase